VARGKRDQLDAPAGQEGIEIDEQRVGSLASQSFERRTDLAAGAG
jgi:hypothetical protein